MVSFFRVEQYQPTEIRCLTNHNSIIGEVSAKQAIKRMTALPDNVQSWLQERGYNPFGDLCVVKPGSGWTLMHQACDAGALNVCQWLWNNGASLTIRTKDSEGWTPMFRACECGHILIAEVCLIFYFLI